MRFTLGDTGTWELPAAWRGTDGVFRATHVRSSLDESRGDSRSDATLVLKVEGEQLHGSLHLEASAPGLRCEVSVGLNGHRTTSTLVAAAY
jgi:hypothetical protein